MVELVCDFHQLVLIHRNIIWDNERFWQISATVYHGKSGYINIDLESKTVFFNQDTYNCKEAPDA